MESTQALIAVVRSERTRIIATLVRRYGFDLAEESVDAAIEAAFAQWPATGVPDAPRAWLLSVARRRAIDRVRHRVTAGEVHAALAVIVGSDSCDEADPGGDPFPDDRLRLVFTCCHPAIDREARVFIALRWLCGLSTEDVARAFCVPVPTMAQRLTRAKAKIETARIPYEVPERRELAARLEAVLEVVYAIFNEGYVATTGPELQRVDLAEQAVHLATMLVGLLPESADVKAMLGLLLLIHARRRARVGADGALIPLERQERYLWDATSLSRGKALLEAALASGPPSTYAIEAAIQAVHADAKTYNETDFTQIVTLYRMLREKTDAPIVKVNLAVANAMVAGSEAALVELEALEAEPTPSGNPTLPAAKADLYRRLGRSREAREAYDQAIAATKNEMEKRFLRQRRDELGGT